MPRNKTILSAAGDAVVKQGVKQGKTAEQIHATLPKEDAGVSIRTIGRRIKELRGGVRSKRSDAAPSTVPPPAPVPTSDAPSPEAIPVYSKPEDVPEGTSVSELQKLLGTCERARMQAEVDQNWPVVSQLIRTSTMILDSIRKATPVAAPDPNDNPDMVTLGAQVAERLHAMVDLVAKEGSGT